MHRMQRACSATMHCACTAHAWQPCTACAPRAHRSVLVRVQALETSELSRRVAALAQSTWVAVAPAAAPVAAAALARRAARRSATGSGTRGGGGGGGGGDGGGGGGGGGGRGWVHRAAFTELLAEVPCPPGGDAPGGEARWLWDCFSPASLEELILTGLLFGYALPSTAGVVLARISARRLRIEPP